MSILINYCQIMIVYQLKHLCWANLCLQSTFLVSSEANSWRPIRVHELFGVRGLFKEIRYVATLLIAHRYIIFFVIANK